MTPEELKEWNELMRLVREYMDEQAEIIRRVLGN